jgi:hypothetical protein
MGVSGLRPSHRPPVEDDFALVRLVKASNDLGQSRFSAAVLTEKRMNLA